MAAEWPVSVKITADSGRPLRPRDGAELPWEKTAAVLLPAHASQQQVRHLRLESLFDFLEKVSGIKPPTKIRRWKAGQFAVNGLASRAALRTRGGESRSFPVV
jgi:hypothetical protein